MTKNINFGGAKLKFWNLILGSKFDFRKLGGKFAIFWILKLQIRAVPCSILGFLSLSSLPLSPESSLHYTMKLWQPPILLARASQFLSPSPSFLSPQAQIDLHQTNTSSPPFSSMRQSPEVRGAWNPQSKCRLLAGAWRVGNTEVS